ncbi:hypothetical protein K501DRAFT_311604 [Backusella circina FSU 941]|nr:hypothetical protein K501DRAFT_311604 [Backusella circina FSU 941]
MTDWLTDSITDPNLRQSVQDVIKSHPSTQGVFKRLVNYFETKSSAQEGDAKRRKLADTTDASSNALLKDEVLRIKDISFQLPARKKYDIIFTSSHLLLFNSKTSQVEHAFNDLTSGCCVPSPDRPAFSFVLKVTDSTTTTTTTLDSSSSFDLLLQEEWVHDLIPNLSHATQCKDFSLLFKLDKVLEYHLNEREQKFAEFSSLLDPTLQRDYKHSLTSWSNERKAMMDLKHSYQTSILKFLLLAGELKFLNRRLEPTERLIHDTRMELEKNSSHSLPPSTMETASAPNTNNTNSNNTTSTESTIQTLLDNQAFSDNQLINVQQTLDQRLKEIEAIKNDRIIIKQQIARLEMDWISMPESRIYKTPMCRNLYNARTNLKEKCNHLYNSCHDIQNKLDDILDQRRMLIKQWNSDKTSRMKGLEGNLKKLDMELTLVRSERDSFQSDLDELKASSSSVGNASFLEWKVISDTRDDLAHYLETELLRLQRKMAAKTGDKLYYDLYLKADPQHSIITILEKDTRQLREKVDQTRHRLANHPQINELDTVSHFIRLDKEATCFEEEHGFHPSVSDEQHAIQILQDRIEQEKEFISQEQHKVTALEPIIQQLLEEIEKVIQLYPELEEQCVTKVQELASAEDEIKQLQLEFQEVNTRKLDCYTFLEKDSIGLGYGNSIGIVLRLGSNGGIIFSEIMRNIIPTNLVLSDDIYTFMLIG